ncbi:hypothetical protein [Hymenobacter sp. UYP22]|uniref:hypothetical protein n=1 Tax=Hymenobacter sp. UYP22 TaxID=3156348 RepID=UPI003395AD0E
MLAACSLLLAGSACQKETDSSPSPAATHATQEAKGAREPKNKGRYLAFATSADFLEAAAQLDKLAPGETTTQHLEQWEKKYGFSSLRARYAKKQQEKELKEKAKASGGTTAMRIPVDGEEPIEPYFEPYSESVDEGLIIHDDFFAAMLSPEGTIQIEDKIFRIDLANNIVSYIPVVQETYYEQFVTDELSESITVRYFNFDEDIFGLLAAGDQGTSFGADFRGTIRIGSGIGCGESADGRKKDEHQYYSSKGRMHCKIVYQPFGIYHSIIAKASHQKKTWYGAWLGSPATMYILPDPGSYWQPMCETYTESNLNSYNNIGAPYFGNETGDHNTVTHRYFNSMKGLKRYKADVKFRVGQYTTPNYHIEHKW